MRLGKVVIPARMDSERLPKKMMIEIMGHPMIEHVWRRARLVLPNQDIVITTDSAAIASHMESMGAQVYLSEYKHNNGSSRVFEYVDKFSLDFAVILQGDEILIRPETILALYNEMLKGDSDFVNVVSPVNQIEDLSRLDVVKCWIDSSNRIRFMFRGNPLRNPIESYGFIKVINGLFAISRQALANSKSISTGIAATESIEQLWFLDMGIELRAHLVESYMPSVNTQDELEKAIEIMALAKDQQQIVGELFPDSIHFFSK